MGEQYNLYEGQPEVAQALMDQLAEYIRTGRSTPGAPQKNCPCKNWPGLDLSLIHICPWTARVG